MGDPSANGGRSWAWIWIVVLVYGVPLLVVAFVGFVKFMAWWRIAFGDCSNG